MDYEPENWLRNDGREPVIDWDRLKEGRAIWRLDPYKVGVFLDTAAGTPPIKHFFNALRMALDEAYEEKLIRKPVQLIKREITGIPYCTFDEVRKAWRELVNEGVIAVCGPWFTPNAVTLIDMIEKDEVPSLSMSVIDEFPGKYRFAWQNGDCAQDSYLMATYAAKQGWTKIGVLHEDNVMGNEYYAHFKRHCRRLKLEIIADQLVPRGSNDRLEGMFTNVRDAKPDVVIYMGLGIDGRRFFEVARDTLGDLPKIVSSSFMGCSTPDYGYGYTIENIEGWIGIDQFDARNPATIEFLDKYEKRWGERPAHSYATQGYDWGRALAEGLAMMHYESPQGLRDALEEVRCLPAVTGGEGTTISFGPYDHRAYRGDSWVSLSRCDNGVITKVDI